MEVLNLEWFNGVKTGKIVFSGVQIEHNEYSRVKHLPNMSLAGAKRSQNHTHFLTIFSDGKEVTSTNSDIRDKVIDITFIPNKYHLRNESARRGYIPTSHHATIIFKTCNCLLSSMEMYGDCFQVTINCINHVVWVAGKN